MEATMAHSVSREVVLGLVVSILLGACADASPTATDLGATRPTLDIVSGNGQSAPAGTELPAPLVVRVITSSGAPVPGQILNFRVIAGGGSVYAGVGVTDGNGRAQEHWTLGSTSGTPQRVEVRAVDSSTGEPVVFGTFTAIAEGGVGTVTVSPGSRTIEVGDSIDFSATLRDSHGNVLTGRPVTWSSSNTSVATIDTNGRLRTRIGGTVTVTATSEGRTGTATVVVEAHVASVTVTPANATMRPLESRQFTATLRDRMGNPLVGRPVTWASTNTVVATVSSSGMVTARIAGNATITATSEGVVGATPVRVSAFQ
jgi:uncharacterized protein YjdB